LRAHREQVDRLFRLDHSSRLDQLDAAFRALDSRLTVELEESVSDQRGRRRRSGRPPSSCEPKANAGARVDLLASADGRD
jgi:hypothetical protein